MNGLNYLLQSNLYLIIFYGFYWVLLRKETFNNFNRAYLVISGIVSFAIPLWNLDLVQSWFITQKATDAIVQMNLPEFVVSNTKVEKSIDVTNYFSIIYGIGCAILGLKLIMNIFNLYRYMYGNTPFSKAFSFFNTIFIADGIDPDDVIYDHERVHASQFHSFDVLLFEIIGVICWFNPVIYLYKTAIKNIHEFIADEIASAKLPSKLDYAMLLFSERFQTHPSILVSNFFTKTSLKLRFEMLNKKRSNKMAVLKYGLILPIFLGMLVFTSAAIAKGEKITEILSFNKSIEGTVLNYNLKPIVGATVVIPNSNIGATTDENGKFKLKTNSAKTELIFSHVSYKTKPLNVLNTEPIKVAMKRRNNELQGTIVLEKQNELMISPAKEAVEKSISTIENNNDYIIGEKNAEYIGGTSELYNYLKSNLRYPKEARKNNKQGVIYTKFVVNEKGGISDVKIVNPIGYMGFVGYGLEVEAKRVVSNMPNWLPALQNGQPVSTDFTLPIQFILDEVALKNENSSYNKVKESIIKNAGNNLNGVAAFNLKDSNKKQENETFGPVEENAKFPGGIKTMQEFLRMNLKYPIAAQKANVSGVVFLSYIIKLNGEIEDIKVLKGKGYGLDEEAIRVVKLMPKWTPAKQSGKEVISRYNLPIEFKLK